MLSQKYSCSHVLASSLTLSWETALVTGSENHHMDLNTRNTFTQIFMLTLIMCRHFKFSLFAYSQLMKFSLLTVSKVIWAWILLESIFLECEHMGICIKIDVFYLVFEGQDLKPELSFSERQLKAIKHLRTWPKLYFLFSLKAKLNTYQFISEVALGLLSIS